MSTSLPFQGKIAFQGINSGQQYYLTRYAGKDHQYLPAMTAPNLTDSEKCILYQVQSNPLIVVIQLASLEYLTLDTTLGWIKLSSDLANAVHFEITSTANQQSWQVTNGQQLSIVCYTAYNKDLPPPLLTINQSPETFTIFTAQIITDDLTTIVANKIANKNGRGIDFINVDLSGQDVSGVDFTGANFTGANLTGTIFKGAILTNAKFIGAILDGTIFDGATLDQANFSGANTVLKTVHWGQPKSAQSINFSGCDGRGTQLVGASGNLIPCNSANVTNANFSGATLSYLTLDDADLTGAIAAGANFTGSSLQRVTGHGANFCGAILNSANLTNGQFGAKVLLFVMTSNVPNDISELNQSDGNQVPSDIVNTFQANGINVSNGIVKTLTTGASWLITVGTTTYNVLLSTDGTQLQIYAYGGATTTTLAGAFLSSSTCSGADFSTVDLSNSVGSGTKADHTDLESTNFAGSFFLEADFTQARVSNTIFSNAILIQTKFIGIDLMNPSFTNAQLQGTDFTNANIVNGNLYQAAISLPNGVPLFIMSMSYTSDLNSGNLAAIAPVFTSQGYPLGSQASLQPSSPQSWLIDNSANTTPPCIKTFAVDQNLNVSDASHSSTILFTLPSTYQPYLAQAHPPHPLMAYFQTKSYPLSAQATISPNITTWQITNSADAPVNLPVVYKQIAIVSEPDGFLHVYGSTLLWLKNFPAYSSDIAFSTTTAIQTSINSATICPNGQPQSEVNAKLYTWEQMMTCPIPPTPS